MLTVVAKVRAADDAAFDAHRKAPHLAAYRARREKEGLTEGVVEAEFYRSLAD